MFSVINPPPRLAWMIAVTVAALLVGTLIRLAALRGTPADVAAKRRAALGTWWVLVVLLAAAVLLGRLGACLLLAVASGLALYEYVGLVARRPEDRTGRWLALATVPVHYLLLALDREQAALMLTPLMTLLLLSIVQVWSDQTANFIRSTAGLFWGVMVLVYGLSHVALLADLPEDTNEVAGPMGWFLYLVLLTVMNDIFQAWVGRRFGAQKRHRIAPRISPNKTWEGLLGSLLLTPLLAIALAPWLTPLATSPLRLGDWRLAIPLLAPSLAGLLVTVSGYFGDIGMSAIKRDAGVKDSSTLLPGMGGVIDRVDSLTFTGPVFYYYLVWFVV